MKLHIMGNFNGDEESLPKREHEPNAVKFKEPENMENFALLTSIASMIVLVILMLITYLRSKSLEMDLWGFVIFAICLVPHEFLHAICFKEDVYMYNNLKQGLLFVVGPEAMTKFRFCFMSLLPCIILGIIPYTIFIINPNLSVLGTMGMLSLASCVGDWLNVFNAITQMPKGAKTYLCGMNSYWYMPKENKDN